MTPDEESRSDLEQRLTDAIAYAGAQERRWSEKFKAEAGSEALASSIHAAAFSAVRLVLEEVLKPGRHSAKDPQPPE